MTAASYNLGLANEMISWYAHNQTDINSCVHNYVYVIDIYELFTNSLTRVNNGRPDTAGLGEIGHVRPFG